MKRRRRKKEPEPSTEIVAPALAAPDDRAWSARRNLGSARRARTSCPTWRCPPRPGPLWAPDELAIWPVEGGRFGLDARYQGSSGRERAVAQAQRLERVNLDATVRENPDGGAILRLGPLAHQAAWVAIEAFLGRPLETE